jgi:hypothetical protein
MSATGTDTVRLTAKLTAVSRSAGLRKRRAAEAPDLDFLAARNSKNPKPSSEQPPN